MRAGGAAFAVETKGSPRKTLDAFRLCVAQAYNRQIIKFAIMLNERLLAKTPVWEGETLRNWRWTIGAPDLGPPIPAVGGTEPGHTNSMALGTEPRRASNEDAQRAGFAIFLGELEASKEPVSVYLTNTAKSAMGVELGLLPTPGQSRSPKGVLYLSVIETLTAMCGR